MVSKPYSSNNNFLLQNVLKGVDRFNAAEQLYAELVTFDVRLSSQEGYVWLRVLPLSSTQEYREDKSCQRKLLNF